MKKMLLGVLMVTSIGAFAQTKKVIVEDYTGLKCGWCPEGTVILEGLHASNPNNCIPIAVHGGGYEPSTSPLKSTEAESVITYVTPAGYPAGAVDRKKFSGESSVAVGRGKWTSYFNSQAATTAKASVGFSNKQYDPMTKEYTADVNIEFTSAPTASTPITVQVMAIEDSIAATGNLAQDNYSSNVQGGASPLNPWWHNRTFRKMLAGTAWTGDATVIPSTVQLNTTYTYKLKFMIPSSWDKDQVHLVAYVAYNSAVNKEIINAEEAHGVSKTFWPAGINDVDRAVSNVSVYPNPASANEMINIQYSINKTSDVTMKVYNLVGQVVAEPYNSHEVKGSHIINWNPTNVAPGLYIVEVSTPEGKQIQKVNIH